MMYHPDKHHRKSIRLNGYDYSNNGAYFVTICTNNRDIIFGHINDGKMELNNYGKIADQYWNEIPNHYPYVILDEYIIMPDHVHGIIIINGGDIGGQNVGVQNVGVQNIEPLHKPSKSKKNEYQKIIPGSIGSIVRGFKIGVTKWFRCNTDIYKIWQRNYYEHSPCEIG